MKYKLIVSPIAEQELYEARNWYTLRKVELGNKFIKEIEKILIHINHNPFQFPKINNSIRKAVSKKFPYTIYYYITEDIINIIAIFHTSRNPKIWKKRINN